MEGKSNTGETRVLPEGILVVWILPLTLFSGQQMVNHEQNMKKSNNLHSSIEAVSVVFGFYQVVEVSSARVFSCIISFSPFSSVTVFTGKWISLKWVSLPRGDRKIKALCLTGITGEDKAKAKHMSLLFVDKLLKPETAFCLDCSWAYHPWLAQAEDWEQSWFQWETPGSVHTLNQVFCSHVAGVISCVLPYLRSWQSSYIPVVLVHV